jgi:hypothetical protein
MADPSLNLQLDLINTCYAQIMAYYENRYCARPGCSNKPSKACIYPKYCSLKCYYWMRARKASRREYKKQYDIANHEKNKKYQAQWRQDHYGYQYISHIHSWRASRFQYTHSHTQHISEFKRQHAISKSARLKLRDKLREELRTMALEAVRQLLDTPVEKTAKQLKKQAHNKKWKDENRKWISEYSKQYRKAHREQTAEQNRKRRIRRRIQADTAITLMKELGVKL